MSGESESVDYSGKLAQLKERMNARFKNKTRERPSICPSILMPTKPADPLEDKCKECIEDNAHDTYFCKFRFRFQKIKSILSGGRRKTE